MFIVCYYLLYWVLFNIKTEKGPLVLYQDKIVLHKDVVGKTLKEFDTDKMYDLLIIGSSHGYRCFDPRIFEKKGISCYNLGSSSQTPLVSYSILKKFINNTRFIIFEVYPVAFNIKGVESFYTLIATDYTDRQLLTSISLQLFDLRCFNILSLKPVISSYINHLPYNIPITYSGYAETTDSIKKEISYETIILNESIIEQQIRYFKKSISLCRDKKIKMILVYAPVPKDLKIIKEEWFLNRIKEISKEGEIEFLNWGRNHDLNVNNHFFDDDHLNASGVKIFNERLIEEIHKSNPGK